MMTEKENIVKIISEIFFQNGHSLGDLCSEIIIKNSKIGFSVDISNIPLAEAENVRENAIKIIKEKLNISDITIILTNDVTNKSNNKKPLHSINEVKNIILVSSCKGGVGKSTVASILAENLFSFGYNTGILDADIYGPSIPTIFNIDNKPVIIDNNLMNPIISRGIQINSIGLLNISDKALAWRGPMASKAIYKLLSLTAWKNLDYLIIDMPPGTGDIALSILENYYINGAIIVTTPQKISQIDVNRSIDLFTKFSTPIIGIIENMSRLNNDNANSIFSGESGKNLSKQYNIPLICQIPLNSLIAAKCDAGESLKDLYQIPLNNLLNMKIT